MTTTAGTPSGSSAGSQLAAIAPTTIVFGTDGWRARVADEFTFDNVRRCADGVARYVVERGEQAKGVVVAYDRRFASEHFAAAAAEVLLAHDIPVAYSEHPVPTQMTSYEVVQRGAAAGIVITASHNPWTDNGFKVKAPTGSAAGPEILAVLEAQIARNGGTRIERRPFAEAERSGLVSRFDPFEGYERFLRRTVDLDGLKAADVRVLVEPMWGAGSGWIPRLLRDGRIDIHEIHRERNPYFGGVNPEPIRPNVDEALGLLAAGGYDMGLLLDGDADRAGAADERGTFIHQLEVTGLLMYYLAEHRGWRDPVVISVNNTSMARRLGERYGIDVYETSVGFKYIGPKMIETGAMMGGEESGGFGFGMHLPERDGIYADLLLLDLFLRERERGIWPVSRILEHFHEVAGPSFYRRIDVHVERSAYAEVKRRLLGELVTQAPAELAGQPVTETVPLATNDGFKFFVADGSWLLVRTSGTEPLVRVYTEATSVDVQEAMLAAGERLVRGA
ncbi:MAG: phosphoglucomutase/phosphomannomutase family protein [Chloroflexota bacterium]